MRLILTAALFALTASAAAGTYRWVDEDGVVHYSDMPKKGAEEIKLREPNLSQGRPVAPAAPSTPAQDAAAAPAAEEGFAGYQTIAIASPGEDEVLWNIGGQLNVELRLNPALQPDHGVVIYLDGVPVNETPVKSTSLSISEVYRGTHTLRAAVRGGGTDLASTETVTFHVRQTSVARPGG